MILIGAGRLTLQVWALAVLASLACTPLCAAGPLGQPALAPCFVPGEDCQGRIIAVIDHAQARLLVQAYSFTSQPIAEALARARGRGVEVLAVLDKSQRHERHSLAQALVEAGIPVWIDAKPAIAHNKVIVADGAVTITGSFNFTASAQERNAENLLVIDDRSIAQAYTHNIESRLAQSVPY